MFANFLQLITGRPTPPHNYEEAFVEEVTVRRPRIRRPGVERLLLGCWVAIAGKCWLTVWLIQKYHVPVHPLWVIAPTVLFALLCTAVYFRRE